MKIKLAIVDDHKIFMEGFSLMLAQQQDFEIICKAINGLDLQQKLEMLNDLPDIAVINPEMPVMSGFETTVWLKKHYPSIRIVICGMEEEELEIVKMITAGSCGLLYKIFEPRQIKAALHAVFTNGYFNPDSFGNGVSFFGASVNNNTIVLTYDEEKLLHFALSDLTYTRILFEMDINERTAKRHLFSLYRKFRVESRPGLALEAMRNIRGNS